MAPHATGSTPQYRSVRATLIAAFLSGNTNGLFTGGRYTVNAPQRLVCALKFPDGG
jgi:hypothetical protein